MSLNLNLADYFLITKLKLYYIKKIPMAVVLHYCILSGAALCLYILLLIFISIICLRWYLPGYKLTIFTWNLLSVLSRYLLLLLLSHFSHVQLYATPSLGFSRQEYWSGVPLTSPANTLVLLKYSSPKFVIQLDFDCSNYS